MRHKIDKGFERAFQSLGFEPSKNGYGPWPTLAQEARYGLPGDALEAIEPHTEADPMAVLVSLLVGFGNAAGRSAHVRVGADRHGLNLFAVLVGETAKSRKGTSWNFTKDLMHAVESFWVEDRVLGGLSSGEGLIYAVRDAVTSVNKDGDPIVVDEGVSDKRLLVVESEFVSVLKIMTREGNTLSALIRQAWDGTRLQTLTRNSPLKASDPHISIIGHVTRDEVLRHLSENDTSNGFANRILWLMVKRSKVLPLGGEWSKVDVAPLVKRLREALEFANDVGELRWGIARGRYGLRSTKNFRRAAWASSGQRQAGRRPKSCASRPSTPQWTLAAPLRRIT